MRRFAMVRRFTCAAIGLVAASLARAQGKPPGTVTISAAVAGTHQFDRDLDGGGRVGWSTGAIGGGVTRQMVPAFAAGLSARFATEDWRIDSPVALGAGAPWRELSRSSVSANLSLALSRTFVLGLSPTLEWALERGASTSDALIYGAVMSAVKVFGPNLTLGGGASVSRQFYSVKVSPFAIVNWKLSERFRIANALPAGPEGGAGIEARWTISPDWELAGGGVIRSDRYRLANAGSFAGLIGETSSMPMFVRLSRKLGADFKADVYAGAQASSRLRIKNGDGDQIARTHDAATPAIAATLSFRR